MPCRIAHRREWFSWNERIIASALPKPIPAADEISLSISSAHYLDFFELVIVNVVLFPDGRIVKPHPHLC